MKKFKLYLKNRLVGLSVILLMLASLFSGVGYADYTVTSDQLRSDNKEKKGEATFFKTTGKGACLFPASPDNLMVAAMNKEDFDGASLCGAFINVRGPLGEVTVRVVDLCPGCESGDIDLSTEAFTKIAKRSMGRVAISWNVVSPELEGPIAYYFKDGSKANVALIQIRNHRNPIARLEYKSKANEWIEIKRTANNYFEKKEGLGAGPFQFRVTDSYGHKLLDENIAYIKNDARNGQEQFPARPEGSLSLKSDQD